MKNIIILSIILLSFTTRAICAETDSTNIFKKGILRYTEWNRPLWADINSNIVRLDIGMATNKAEYDWAERGGEYRPYFWGNIGLDLQLWSSDFANEKIGLAISAPCSFLIWQDVFGRGTFAVINTDYRIGFGDISFIHRVKNHGLFKNYTIRYAPFRHESTHIGDELTIKRKDEELAITRIDVNYNYSEFVFGINDPDGRKAMNHHFRIGGLIPLSQRKGWYAFLYAEADKEKVEKVKSPYDFYAQYQFQTNTSRSSLQGIFSLEVRNRSVYNYPYYDKKGEEEWTEYISYKERQWSINGFIGIRYNYRTGIFSKVGLGIRGYYGLNPYGQYRNTPDYKQLGISLIFE